MKLPQFLHFTLGLSLCLFLIGCKGGISFEIINDATFTVPSAIGISLPLSIPTGDVETNAEQEFESNDTKAKWVKKITLESLQLSIKNPVSEDFSFLKSIHLYMDAEGLDEVEIAYFNNLDNNAGNSFDLVSTMVDLAAYVKKETYKLRVNVVTDETLLYDVTVGIDLRFHVIATIPAFAH